MTRLFCSLCSTLGRRRWAFGILSVCGLALGCSLAEEASTDGAGAESGKMRREEGVSYERLGTFAQSVDRTTLHGKLIMGYQGWFTALGDGSSLPWLHWFRNNTPSAANLTVEMWPNVSEIPSSALFDTQMKYADGSTARLYSAYRPEPVDVHFRWMKEYGIDGAALQRFTSELTSPPHRDFRDQVTRNVRQAAEQHGRVFFVMYDISGTNNADVVSRIQKDWMHLVDDLQVTTSGRYLQHRGRPLVSVWGFGFKRDDSSVQPDPHQAMEVIDWFHHNAPAQYRATVMGGVPSRWRLRTDDALSDPLWVDVYKRLDVISPWSVGRYRDGSSLSSFCANVAAGDSTEAASYGADYLPVVWPGFSWRNLYPGSPHNDIPRRAGQFWWDQVVAFRGQGAGMLYGAMFDEVDEATAMFKLAATAQEAPVAGSWLTLDADGTALPTDWYLRVAAETARVLRGEATLQNVFPLLDGTSGTEPCEPPHTVDVGGQCVPSCGHAGGTCGPQGSACSGELVTSYDCAACCKTSTAPAPTCNPPHSILVNGQCVPSCGHAGGTCGPQGSACSGELVTSYDCAACCKTTTAPAPTCNPPHSILVNGQCVPSCGHAGGVCGPAGTPCGGQALTSYDCEVCCKP